MVPTAPSPYYVGKISWYKSLGVFPLLEICEKSRCVKRQELVSNDRGTKATDVYMEPRFFVRYAISSHLFTS